MTDVVKKWLIYIFYIIHKLLAYRIVERDNEGKWDGIMTQGQTCVPVSTTAQMCREHVHYPLHTFDLYYCSTHTITEIER